MPVYEVTVSYEETFLVEADNFDDAYNFSRDEVDNGLGVSNNDLGIYLSQVHYHLTEQQRNQVKKVPLNYTNEN